MLLRLFVLLFHIIWNYHITVFSVFSKVRMVDWNQPWCGNLCTIELAKTTKRTWFTVSLSRFKKVVKNNSDFKWMYYVCSHYVLDRQSLRKHLQLVWKLFSDQRGSCSHNWHLRCLCLFIFFLTLTQRTSTNNHVAITFPLNRNQLGYPYRSLAKINESILWE